MENKQPQNPQSTPSTPSVPGGNVPPPSATPSSQPPIPETQIIIPSDPAPQVQEGVPPSIDPTPPTVLNPSESSVNSPVAAPQPKQRPFIPLNHDIAMLKPKTTKPQRVLILMIVILLVIVGGVYAFYNLGHKTSYQTVVQEFITAMQTNDKAKADALTSPQAKTLYQQHEGTNSIYTFCQKTGTLCTYYFSSKFLGATTTTTKDYTFPGNIKGKEVIYTSKDNLPIGNTGCTSQSTSTLTIGVIPSGSTWLIYGAGPSTSFSAKLC